MKLTDTTRSTSWSDETRCSLRKARWASGVNGSAGSKARCQAPVRCVGVSPRYGSQTRSRAACTGSRSSRTLNTTASLPAGRRPAPVQRAPEVRRTVEGLGHDDAVHARIVERERFGGAVGHSDVRQRPRQHLPHAGHGFDRDELGAGRHEIARDLPRAGCEVDDRGIGTDPERLDHELDGLGGIARAAAVVGVGLPVEPSRSRVVDVAHATTGARPGAKARSTSAGAGTNARSNTPARCRARSAASRRP